MRKAKPRNLWLADISEPGNERQSGNQVSRPLSASSRGTFHPHTHTHMHTRQCITQHIAHTPFKKENKMWLKVGMRLKSKVCVKERGPLYGTLMPINYILCHFAKSGTSGDSTDWIQFPKTNIQQGSCAVRQSWVYNSTRSEFLFFISAFWQALRRNKSLCGSKGGRIPIYLE